MNDPNPHALILPTPPAPATNGGLDGLEELRDIQAPVQIPSDWTWLWWVLGTMAVLSLLSLLAVWLYRARKEALYVSPIPPHVRALRRLAEALAFLVLEPKLFCIEVSTTLRIYLEEQFQFRAPERTTEEFLHELQSSPLLNAAQKKSLADFLNRCDLVKFARYQPMESELRDLHAAAVRLVEETTPQPVAAGPAAPTRPPTAQPPPQALPPVNAA